MTFLRHYDDDNDDIAAQRHHHRLLPPGQGQPTRPAWQRQGDSSLSNVSPENVESVFMPFLRYQCNTWKLLSGSADRRPQRHGLLGRSHQEPGRGEENIFMMSIFTNSNAGLPRWTCTACSGAQWDPAPLTRQTPWPARCCRYLLIYTAYLPII